MKRLNKLFFLSLVFVFSSCRKIETSSLSSNFPLQENLLKEVMSPNSFDESKLKDDNFINYLNNLEDFSCLFSKNFIQDDKNYENTIISPLSLYLSLISASEISKDNTRLEIITALKNSYEDIKTYTKDLINMLYQKTEINNKIVSYFDLANAIFIDKNVSYQDETIDSLALNYYCYPYQVDFMNENKTANDIIKNFVETKTNKLINWSNNYNQNTKLVLLNTLYLKDSWSFQIPSLATLEKDFYSLENKNLKKKFLESSYISGKVKDEKDFSHFYVKTANNYKIKFILPHQDKFLKDVLSEENIKYVNNYKNYIAIDEKEKKHYYTSCIFPEFESNLNKDLTSILKEKFSINDLFDQYRCNLQFHLKDENIYCEQLIQQAKINVNEKGIEASAVTSLGFNSTTGLPEYENVYEKFYLDYNFAYIITDPNDVMLFLGTIYR